MPVWRAALRPQVRADAYEHLLVSHVSESIGQLLPSLHRCSARRLCLDPRATQHLLLVSSRRTRLLPRVWHTPHVQPRCGRSYLRHRRQSRPAVRFTVRGAIRHREPTTLCRQDYARRGYHKRSVDSASTWQLCHTPTSRSRHTRVAADLVSVTHLAILCGDSRRTYCGCLRPSARAHAWLITLTSGSGTKRTSNYCPAMSAIGGKADIN